MNTPTPAVIRILVYSQREGREIANPGSQKQVMPKLRGYASLRETDALKHFQPLPL
jgi:hypothetical protein